MFTSWLFFAYNRTYATAESLEDADVSRCLDMSDLVEVMLQDDFNGEYIEQN